MAVLERICRERLAVGLQGWVLVEVVEFPRQLLCSSVVVGSWRELKDLLVSRGGAPRSGARGQGAFSGGGPLWAVWHSPACGQ